MDDEEFAAHLRRTKDVVPRSWSEVTRALANDLMHLIGRKPEVFEAYGCHMRRVSKVYQRIDDYVLCEYFSRPWMENEDRKRVALRVEADPASSVSPYVEGSEPTGHSWRLLDNHFPYNVVDEVVHEVLWCTRPLSAKEVEATLGAIMSVRGRQYCYREHGSSYKSVKSVWHVQVFSTTQNG